MQRTNELVLTILHVISLNDGNKFTFGTLGIF